jgi:hypothetical protein
MFAGTLINHVNGTKTRPNIIQFFSLKMNKFYDMKQLHTNWTKLGKKR